jgi:hypothetical protein
MNVNNYECPKCHNVFPESNKFLHDQRCTASNPVPLNQSRIAFINEQEKNKKKEPVKHITSPNYQANRNLPNNNRRQNPQKIEEEKVFTCWLCGNTLKEKEKTDHMLCHQMQEENEAFKNKNKKEEKNQINKNNNINRPKRDIPNIPNRLGNNQRNQQINIRPQNNQGQQGNRNLKRSQLKFSDWQIFDFGGLRESLNKMDNPTDEDILEQLPESEIEDVSQLSEEKKECIICLINFKKSDKITILPCTHMFHSYCVESWLKAKDFCPVCKHKIARDNL